MTMATLVRGATNRKEKITISIDANLLHVIDTFVDEAKDSNLSRSSVLEQAVYLWKQAIRDSFDAQYYSQNADRLNDGNWSEITTEAAKHIWKD